MANKKGMLEFKIGSRMNQFTTGIFYSSELAPKILRHCEVMKTPQNNY